jgi:hypothetical protein
VDNSLSAIYIVSPSYPYSGDSAFTKYLSSPSHTDSITFTKLLETIDTLQSDEYGSPEDGLGYMIKIVDTDSIVAVKYLTNVQKRDLFFQNWDVILKNDTTELRKKLESIFWQTSKSFVQPKRVKKRR